ncbi:MAG: LysM peptidoglycan-binding domain-containing M23 family metallopeptidase [Acidimicrobiales bacterium]
MPQTLRRAARTAVVIAGVVGLAHTGRHEVRPGETASGIARQYGITASALAAANGLADADRLVAGTVLVIPGRATAAPAATSHVIARGETLQVIARRYGTSVTALVQANRVTNPNLIVAGRTITIPGAGTTGGAAPAGAHTVTAGETLSQIARRYGLSTSQLVGANGIANPNLVRAGARLAIPSAGSGGAPAGSPSASNGQTGVAGTHTVRSGESLAAIARRYGIPIVALAAANGIPEPYGVFTGARLDLSAPNRLPGALGRCPVPGGRFVNDWGFPRSGGRAHQGNDLFAPRGTAIAAPVAGTVSDATGSMGGNQFRLTGDDGTTYSGSHLDAFGTQGRVSAGTTVGYVGNTGNARGGPTHLHFEIHPGGGRAVNPFQVLRAAC